MTAGSSVGTAFTAWAYAELAAHYASCPDEVMDYMTSVTSERELELAALPAWTAEEALLKVFPLLLATYEPKLGNPPMAPVMGESNNGTGELLASVIDDLRRLVPSLADIMAMPNRRDFRTAA